MPYNPFITTKQYKTQNIKRFLTVADMLQKIERIEN